MDEHTFLTLARLQADEQRLARATGPMQRCECIGDLSATHLAAGAVSGQTQGAMSWDEHSKLQHPG